MNKLELFDYERFISLTGSALVSYAEPFVNTRPDAIPQAVYDLLIRDLPTLDEEHTVYALEICMALKPSEFASTVVGFLAHPDAAICVTAYRLLKRIPPESLRFDLWSRIAATPEIDLFAPDVRTGNLIRVGSNKEFIRDLVATFASKSS
jgi:hypothetical protein